MGCRCGSADGCIIKTIIVFILIQNIHYLTTWSLARKVEKILTNRFQS